MTSHDFTTQVVHDLEVQATFSPTIAFGPQEHMVAPWKPEEHGGYERGDVFGELVSLYYLLANCKFKLFARTQFLHIIVQG